MSNGIVGNQYCAKASQRGSNVMKRNAALIVTVLLAASTGICQLKTDSVSRPEFEVASIKPSNPNASPGGGIKAMPGGQTYVATNVPVKLMIELMFNFNVKQVSGGPSWLDTDLYDVEAKADRPRTLDELHVMFQNLLIDRFKLQFHKETKMLPAYELTVDKSGPKLKQNMSPDQFDVPVRMTGWGKLEATRCSMSAFVWRISQLVDRPVFDETGLDQYYDFKLEWARERPVNLNAGGDAGASPPPMNGPDIFTALREQLGLKLESHKGPVAVMVIDHVEKPSEN
jgi:uncharacterized protein (TIGR03435 family)